MISTKGRYALRVMVFLARTEQDKHIPLREIATHENMSVKYLETILNGLVKQGLLEGQRGKNGGYRLTRLPGEYSLLEILELTEGTLAPVACLEEGAEECVRASVCPTVGTWRRLKELIESFFSETSLADLARDSESANAS